MAGRFQISDVTQKFVSLRIRFSTAVLRGIVVPPLVGLAFFVHGALAAAQEGASAKDLLNKAYALSQKAETVEQFTAVIQQCRQGLSANPNEASRKYANDLISWSLNRRGELQADADKGEEALKDFEEAVKLKADNWRALHNRGVSYALVGKQEEALADFNQAIKLERNYAPVFFNRGELYSSQGRWTEAIADYTQALKLNDKDARSLTNRGYAHYQMRNYDQALADYGRAIAADKDWAPAYVHRGALHGDIARWKQAADDYRQALKIDPQFGHAYQQIAWLLATCPDKQYRDPKVALDAAKKGIELDGDRDFHYLDTLAAAYAVNGQYDKAVEAIKKAIGQLPMGFEVFKTDLESRQKLYEKQEPYVEQAPMPNK